MRPESDSLIVPWSRVSEKGFGVASKQLSRARIIDGRSAARPLRYSEADDGIACSCIPSSAMKAVETLTIMRDPNRIEVIIGELRDFWLAHPDLRLGQILVKASEALHGEPDLFHVEDARVLEGIRKLRERLGGGFGQE